MAPLHAKLIKLVADEPDDDGMTAQELAATTNLSLRTLQVRLKELDVKGLLIVGSRASKDGMGRRCRVPVYRIKEEK